MASAEPTDEEQLSAATFRAQYRGWRTGGAHGGAMGSQGPQQDAELDDEEMSTADLLECRPHLEGLDLVVPPEGVLDARRSPEADASIGWVPPQEQGGFTLDEGGEGEDEDEGEEEEEVVAEGDDAWEFSEADTAGAVPQPGPGELEYFPAPPTLNNRRSLADVLRDDLRSEICDAVARSIVGPNETAFPAEEGGRVVVINHLYEPALRRVKDHFSIFPNRYCFTSRPDCVAQDLRLVAEAQRDPLGVQLLATVCPPAPRTFMVTVAFSDRPNVLDVITRCLTSVPVTIQDADCMTSSTGIALDHFIVIGDEHLTVDALHALIPAIHLSLGLPVPHGGSAESSPGPFADISARRGAESDYDGGMSSDWGDEEEDEEDDEEEEDFAADVDTDGEEEGDAAGAEGGVAVLRTLRLSELRLRKRTAVSEEGAVSVWKAQWAGLKVVVKMLCLRETEPEPEVAAELLQEFVEEAAIVSRLRHRSLQAFIGAARSRTKTALVYERLEGTTLQKRLQDGPPLAPQEVLHLAIEIAEGLQYLHASEVLHRDIRSANLVFDRQGNIKITNFGLACTTNPEQELAGETGSYRWMAPEVIRHEPYGTAADVYSFSIVMCELLTGRLPFEGMTARDAAIAVASGDCRPTLPEEISPPELRALIQSCWDGEPERRPSSADLIPLLKRLLPAPLPEAAGASGV